MNVIRADLRRSRAGLEVRDAVATKPRDHAGSPDGAFVVIYTIGRSCAKDDRSRR
jgi:hypothetical protein